MQNDVVEINKPPRASIRQRIITLTVTLLITVSWCALVTILAVIMIRFGVPETSLDPNEPEYFYDTGVWDTPVH